MAVSKLGLMGVPAQANPHPPNFDQIPAPEQINIGALVVAVRLTVDGVSNLCTVDGILEGAQDETGLSIKEVTTKATIAAHFLRYRERLNTRLAATWKHSDAGDMELVVPDPIVVSELSIAFTAQLLAIWRVDARRTADQVYIPVNIVQRFDADVHKDPKILLRESSAVLLNGAAAWSGVYDRLRIQGTSELDASALDWAVDLLHPNELVATLFCRCLELEAARFLAAKAGEGGIAGLKEDERQRAEQLLFQQVDNIRRQESNRR